MLSHRYHVICLTEQLHNVRGTVQAIIFALPFVIRVIKYVYNDTGALNLILCVLYTNHFFICSGRGASLSYVVLLCAVCKDCMHCFTLIKAGLLAGQCGQLCSGPWVHSGNESMMIL